MQLRCKILIGSSIDAKLNIIDMKRITVTLPDQTAAALEDWAAQQGRPTANLAAFLIEQSMIQARETGRYSSSDSIPVAQTK